MSAAAPLTDPADLATLMDEGRIAAEALLGDAIDAVHDRVCAGGRRDAMLMAREQRATHGLAWFATHVQAIRQLAFYSGRMADAGRLRDFEALLVRIGAGECLAQMAGGIPMSQGELVRPADLGLDAYTVAARIGPAIGELVATGNTAENRARLVALLADRAGGANAGDLGLDDALGVLRAQRSARIQAAARAIGVAQEAMEAALACANERVQFGRMLIAFPRVADKIAMMAVEITIAREIAFAAAREKDKGRRCDLETGMATLFAARVAWAAADSAAQIHGRDGFAPESRVPQLLRDARILRACDGTAEIQAEAIARRLLED